MLTVVADALFLPDGERWLPTDWARGPWSPDALHGGPVAALTAREVERQEAPGPMLLARLTLELMRPVPLRPLTVTGRVSRPGRKVQLVDVSVRDGELEVARATGLRVRLADVPLPPDLDTAVGTGATVGVPGPAESSPQADTWRWRAYHNSAVEVRYARGAWTELGAASVWLRLLVPVVPDEEPSPVVRAMAAADFGNGVSQVLPFGRYFFLNPELTVHLLRPPVGEWVRLDATSHVAAHGVGFADSAIADERGLIGRAAQSLLVEARPPKDGP
jgi:hypothetical protein